MNELNLTPQDVDELFSPATIRDRAKKIFKLTQEGQTAFHYHADKLRPTIDYVMGVIKKKYPSLDIPFHSRWGHFQVGGVDRIANLNAQIKDLDSLERARLKLDLVITSVLLDAGAGSNWSYLEKETQKKFSRSEGLGVASWHMFLEGHMSSDRRSTRADAAGLSMVTEKELASCFQVSDSNPLIGIEGRALLLNNLGSALGNRALFKDRRPGNILDFVMQKYRRSIPASGLLRAVLDGFGPIWPGRLQSAGRNLGDVWRYEKLSGARTVERLVPFHKLSQWMTYSLIEPIIEAGIEVKDVNELTGLAEYRNGGLFVDTGLISLRDPSAERQKWRPDSDLVIEWRALTIYLLDLIGEAIRKELGKSEDDFPLAKVLEGGTWWAGRYLAAEKRPDGSPPIQIESDGTVF